MALPEIAKNTIQLYVRSGDTFEEINRTMGGIVKARALFKEAGLAFPVFPRKLASSLKERGKWLYSTRPIEISPYDLMDYVNEAGASHTDDYAVLSHSGHGANSYAIQYYLVCGPLRMLLFLGWGGIYMDNQKEASKIQECFGLANRIVKASAKKLRSDSRLMVVVSDCYGSYWSPHVNAGPVSLSHSKTPQQVLREVLDWLAGL